MAIRTGRALYEGATPTHAAGFLESLFGFLKSFFGFLESIFLGAAEVGPTPLAGFTVHGVWAALDMHMLSMR